jgi:hypothetical protein
MSFKRVFVLIIAVMLLAAMITTAQPPATQPTTRPDDSKFEMTVPSTTRRSMGLKWSCTFSGNNLVPGLSYTDCRVSTTVSGIRLDYNRGVGPTTTGLTTGIGPGGAGFECAEPLDDPQYDSLKPGPQILEYTCVISCYGKGYDPSVGTTDPPISRRTIQGKVKWTLLPEEPSSPLMPTHWDHSLQAGVERSMEIHCLRNPDNPKWVQVRIAVNAPPVGMGFNVFRKLDHFIFDIPMSPVAWRPGDHAGNEYLAETYCEPDEKELTLVFNPSPVAAATLLKQDPFHLSGLKEIWNGKVIRKVVIETSPRPLSEMPANLSQAARSAAWNYLLDHTVVSDQLRRDGDLQKAGDTLRQALSKNPSDLQVLTDLGFLSEASDDWAAAPDYFSRVIAIGASPQHDRSVEELNRLGALFTEGNLQTDPGCAYFLALAEQAGFPIPLKDKHSRQLIRDSANGGYAPAMVALCRLYQSELERKSLTPQAADWYRSEINRWYRKAASQGNADAVKWVGEQK